MADALTPHLMPATSQTTTVATAVAWELAACANQTVMAVEVTVLLIIWLFVLFRPDPEQIRVYGYAMMAAQFSSIAFAVYANVSLYMKLRVSEQAAAGVSTDGYAPINAV